MNNIDYSPFLRFHCGDRDRAILHFEANIELSESFYPCLSLLEVGFRNNIHLHLSKFFQDQCWLLHPEFFNKLSPIQKGSIRKASSKLKLNNGDSERSLISELSFGFWTSLLDSRYELILSKPLRLSFPNCPRHIRQRRTISSNMNQARILRNKIFHHQPIFWNSNWARKQHECLLILLLWLDTDLMKLGQKMSRFREIQKKYLWLFR